MGRVFPGLPVGTTHTNQCRAGAGKVEVRKHWVQDGSNCRRGGRFCVVFSPVRGGNCETPESDRVLSSLFLRLWSSGLVEGVLCETDESRRRLGKG